MNSTTFKWLLKREYWEHRIGFFWAPVITAGLWTFLMILLIIVGEIVAAKVGGNHGIKLGHINLSNLADQMTDEQRQQAGGAIDLLTAVWSSIPIAVASLVAFFYCLGALFDDRRDRSILFWKSLPVSDRDTVLSKVVTATITIPVIGTAVGVVTGFAWMIIASIVTLAFHGINPFTTIWSMASPFSLFAEFLGNFPVFFLWSLPTIGWLLLVSAWARSLPFIWAVFTPIFFGIVVSISGLMSDLGSTSGWFWRHVVGRLLTGTVPYMHTAYRAASGSLDNLEVHGPRDVLTIFSPMTSWGSLATLELWIGAAAGVAMIYAAMRLRTSRELAD